MVAGTRRGCQARRSRSPVASSLLPTPSMLCRHRRPYKPAWAAEDAWWEIARKAGTDFDPGVVDAFTKVLRSTGLNLGVQS